MLFEMAEIIIGLGLLIAASIGIYVGGDTNHYITYGCLGSFGVVLLLHAISTIARVLMLQSKIIRAMGESIIHLAESDDE